ncbi:cystathionine beta-lyase [Candidatus Hodgkinia cicadicola]|uniref:Cystathionine beta-lyase n=1 Tax=Candidatus Hodgkinia cicadicola TaxID=573658 RepID=A0ABX4MGP3_9HYPH|nr:cystathionine beta-lyase [Candidatus Hodgkinia cicadicola]
MKNSIIFIGNNKINGGLVLYAIKIIYIKTEDCKNRKQTMINSSNSSKGVFYSSKGSSLLWTSPAIYNLCTAFSILEHSNETILTSSRLMALTLMLMQVLKPGDHGLVVDSVYYPMKEYCKTVLSGLNINIDFFDSRNEFNFKTLFRTNTKLVHLESPCSDTTEIQNIDEICRYVKNRSTKCIISMDNSWATFLIYKPLLHGVDISICNLNKHLTQWLNIDITSISSTRTVSYLFTKFKNLVDLTCNNFDVNTILNNLKSSIIRIWQNQNSIIKLCKYLYAMRYLCHVFCPALPSSLDHELWKKAYKLQNNIISFRLNKGSIEKHERFVANLRDFKTKLCDDNTSTASVFVVKDRGFEPKQTYPIIRLQIGSENIDHLMNDLNLAFLTIR